MAVVAMMSVVSMQAQSDDFCRHEVAVSFGAASNSDWVNALGHITTVMVTVRGVKYENEKYAGPFSAEYFYHLCLWSEHAGRDEWWHEVG